MSLLQTEACEEIHSVKIRDDSAVGTERAGKDGITGQQNTQMGS